MSLRERFSLDGEVAVVTGAAQGLGRQMAAGLAEMGADVAIADLNHEKGTDTAAELDGETRVIAVETDAPGDTDTTAALAALREAI